MRKSIILSSLLLLLTFPSISLAARLWVDPGALYFQYQKNGASVNATVTVSNLDMDMNGTFAWTASTDAQWLSLENPGMSHSGPGSFKVSLDTAVLDTMQSGPYTASIAIMSDMGSKFFVPVSLNYMPSTEVQTLNLPTSAWLDTVMEVPASVLNQAKLYVLMEHPTLLPGKTYAYRCSAAGNGSESNCSFDLYSQNGHLMPNAADLYYDSDAMLNLMTNTVEIPFGGFRLAGLDGQIRVHCMAGSPAPGSRYGMYSLLDLTINIMPLQGQWDVIDNFFGSEYAYAANLYETFGNIDGLWDGIAVPYFDYINPSNSMPSDPKIIGSNVYVKNSSLMTGYELKFSRYNDVLKQNEDYWYQITDLTDFDDGIVSGIWRMKESSHTDWSVPQKFSATRTDWEYVIPFNRVTFRDSYVTTAYVSSSTVTKYPVAFIVDTGAEMVLMDKADMQYILHPEEIDAKCVESTGIGAGGNLIVITKCPGITLQLTDKIKLENMDIYFTDNQTPGLLGMDFLKHFNIRFRSSDHAMIISP
jgi:hypothetical protein